MLELVSGNVTWAVGEYKSNEYLISMTGADTGKKKKKSIAHLDFNGHIFVQIMLNRRF